MLQEIRDFPSVFNLNQKVTDSGAVKIEMEIGPFKEKHIDVYIDKNNYLCISGIRNTVVKKTGEQRQRSFVFEQSLPSNIKNVDWSVRNGKLQITLS